MKSSFPLLHRNFVSCSTTVIIIIIISRTRLSPQIYLNRREWQLKNMPHCLRDTTTCDFFDTHHFIFISFHFTLISIRNPAKPEHFLIITNNCNTIWAQAASQADFFEIQFIIAGSNVLGMKHISKLCIFGKTQWN